MDKPFLLLCGTLAMMTFGGTLLALRPGALARPLVERPEIGDLPDCRSARALGAVNIRRGEPGYRPALDPDGDGLACEAVPADGAAAAF